MLYAKNNQPLGEELFREPTAEYRATPFWAWNCELRPELLSAEIDAMKEMGFGGFHMHSRVGMATPYLSDAFMGLVRGCVEKAKKEDMLAWLYDEDKWPSGFAGGLNTKKIENRAKTLILNPLPFRGDEDAADGEAPREDLPGIKGELLACYDIELSDDGFLISYRRIGRGDHAPHQKWFAYLVYAGADNWYNGQAYADTLSRAAIEDFVQITHERYKACVGNDFGGAVPAIFTDEPQFSRKFMLNRPADRSRVTVPYTTDFDTTFRAAYGYSILDTFPEVVWELPDHAVSQVRYHFHDHVAERFSSAFADTVGAWCRKNGIHLTGHMMEEPSLLSQTSALGEAMRSYRGFSLPGIDMLCDNRELTTAKQCQSAVHQYGCEGMLSELYGVTNWDFDFRGHKLQGDWQAALGVTVRVPHLFWVSMSGEAKRDYPACIGYQSPWYREYKYIEDHFARVNTVMTRGVPDVRIGMIHPVESYWLRFGPYAQTAPFRDEMENRFGEMIRWMLMSTLDFDYVCESQLPAQYDAAGEGFAVGKMHYDVIVVPSLLTMRRTTLDALRAFRKKGGTVLFVGDIPDYVDALPCADVRAFAATCRCIPWSRVQLHSELEPFRTVSVCDCGAYRSWNIIYQLRTEGDGKHLFFAHVDKPGNYDIVGYEEYEIGVAGEWEVTERDTLTGQIRPLAASYRNGKTFFHWGTAACGSLLVDLKPGKREDGFVPHAPRFGVSWRLAERVPFTLSEPNVLLLDRPAYSLNGGETYAPEYILKADDHIRSLLGIRHRNDGMVQPWVTPLDRDPSDRVKLIFSFESELDYTGARLGMEAPEFTSSLRFNGQEVPLVQDGFYIDPDSIRTVPLPPIVRGTNRIELELRFGDATQLESYYLLGDFGVCVDGSRARIVPLTDKLSCGSYTTQTLPFYGGNVTYHYTVEGGGHRTLELSRYRGSAVIVDVDGIRAGHLSLPPYRLDLGVLAPGTHTVDITLCGNRMNTLGSIHNTDEFCPCGPFVWRSENDRFAYEYFLRPTGLLTTPRLLDTL